MKYFLLLAALMAAAVHGVAQKADKAITVAETRRILTTLSANDMEGRRAGTPGIEKAAAFLAAEWKAAGLQPMPGAGGYLQTFTVIKPTQQSLAATINGRAVPASAVTVFTGGEQLSVNQQSGYAVKHITNGNNFFGQVQELLAGDENQLVVVDTSLAWQFSFLPRLRRMMFAPAANTLFVLAPSAPGSYSIAYTQTVEAVQMSNVVGMLPGRSKKQEYVVFSGHYDHLGIGKPENGDSIYNGANDDASGTTAVVMLAKYYKALGKNQRTLVFAAFTAEEIGGYGSQYFSRQLPADKVAAMFNIEMIGTQSKWNTNSAYITGFEKTDMGTIMQKNLKGSGFSFYADPYPDQQLFYRSDNATLARLGVPAHTISTSKMDNEPNYHKASDEVSTLDVDNMTRIIRSIAISAASIVKGIDTPSRVKPDTLLR